MPIRVDGCPATMRRLPPCSSNEQLSLTSTCSMRTSDFPGIGTTQPIVGLLALPARFDRLTKNAVLVAQAVSHRGELHRGHRIEKACRQPAQATIAQPGVRLLFEQLQPVEVLLLRRPSLTIGSSSRFVTLLASPRPIRNSIDR